MGPLNSKSSVECFASMPSNRKRWHVSASPVHRLSIRPCIPYANPLFSPRTSHNPPPPHPSIHLSILPFFHNRIFPNALCGSNKIDVYYRFKIRSFLILFQFDCRAHRATTSTCGQTLFAKEIQLRFLCGNLKTGQILFIPHLVIFILYYIYWCVCRSSSPLAFYLNVTNYEYGWFLPDICTH